MVEGAGSKRGNWPTFASFDDKSIEYKEIHIIIIISS